MSGSTGIHAARDEFNDRMLNIQPDNWQDVFTDFTELLSSVEKNPYEERLAKGWLARLLEKTYFSYRHIGETAIDLSNDWGDMQDEIGSTLPDTVDNSPIAGKRQPSFLESVTATLARYSIIETLPSLLEGSVDATIIGGSMSYGPFFNVRDNRHGQSSDIDVIFVGNATLLEKPIEITDTQTALSETDIMTLAARSKTFSELYQIGKANVLSQRFSLPDHTFNISAHFFTKDSLDTLIGARIEEQLAEGQDKLVLFNDFKPSPFIHPTCFQQGFDGTRREYHVSDQQSVPGGFITRISGYEVADSRMYLGLYHQLISPEYSVYSDVNGETTSRVDSFRRAMIQQLRREQQTSPESSLARCHTRYPIFAPERYAI